MLGRTEKIAPVLRIKLLGNAHLSDGDIELKIPSRRLSLPLLAYLLLHRNKAIARSHLAFTLWPDDSEEHALAELRRHIYLLGKAFATVSSGGPWLLADTETVAWSKDATYWLDVAEFERCSQDESCRADAVTLYDGDLLPDIYDDWLVSERERLRRLLLDDLWALILARRSDRAFSEAQHFAQRLLDVDPWREDALRQLMSIRYESGDAAGALAAFDRFAQRLRAEMDVEPMPETLALRHAIVRGAPVEAAPKSEEARVLPLRGPFVGRASELEQLRAVWRRAARGHGSVAVVSGEAGIGKTRLVGELALAAESEGARVLFGSTSFPEHEPYQCIASALRSNLPLLANLSLSPSLLGIIAKIVPELRSGRPDLPLPVPLTDESEKSRLLDAVAQAMIALARPRPMVLILEDLHWSGYATVEAVASLANRIAATPILIVLTYREEQVGRAHPLRRLEHGLQSAHLTSRVTLEGLKPEAVGELVTAIVPGRNDAAEMVRSVFETSEGNPLFVTEILRNIAGNGNRDELPRSIRAAIADRLNTLEPATRAIGEIAAVAGQAFTIELVRETAGVSESEVLQALDELLERHLVREVSAKNRFDYAFTHHLIQSAIYEEVEPKSRRRRHGRIARVLQDLYPEVAAEMAAEIAFHLDRAGDVESAAQHYAVAARHAADLYANDDARALAERALELHPGADRLRYELLLVCESIDSRLGEKAKQKSRLEALEALVPVLDERASAEVLMRRIECAFRNNDRSEELLAIEKLRERALAAHNASWLAFSMEALAQRKLATFDYSGALADAESAFRSYQQQGSSAGCVRSRAIASSAAAGAGDAEGAAQYVDQAIAIAERSGEPALLVRALQTAATTAQQRQDYVRFAEFAERALVLCRTIGDREAEGFAHNQIGTANWSLWRPEIAFAHLRKAVDVFTSVGSTRLAVALTNLGGFLMELGEFEASATTSERAHRLALEEHLYDAAGVALSNLAELARFRGRVKDLRAVADRMANAPWRVAAPRQEAIFLEIQGWLLRATGKFEASLQAFNEVKRRHLELGRLLDAREALDDYALALLGAGRYADAVAALSEANDLRGQPNMLIYETLHYWITALVHHAVDDVPKTTEALARAKALFEVRRAAIEAPEIRARFETIPHHVALVAASERNVWPAHGAIAGPANSVPDDQR